MNESVALPSPDATAIRESHTVAWHCPDFKVSGVFGSHMVLQREAPIRIWGFSNNIGSRVAGSFMGETVTTSVGEDNRWVLTFSARAYTREPQIMVISDDQAHTVTMEDILIGDVYLIGGQSNAELNLLPCMELTPSIEFDEDDSFRLFAQTQAFVYEHQNFCVEPQPDIINPNWYWRKPDREASLSFSAMGWYFARELQKQIDVPLGLIMICAGGACLSELLPVELAHAQGYTSGNAVPEGGYYNALTHPFVGLSFRAMLFFQGESEGCFPDRAVRYAYELTLLVTDARIRFGRPFPFYNVQLSDYGENGLQVFPYHDIVRVQQFQALSLISDSTLTVDMDLGAPDDYIDWPHSPRKLELGERLSRLVAAKEYGIGRISEHQSPRPVTAAISEDCRHILVEFTDVDAGLIVSGHTPADSYGMEVQGFSIGDYEHRTPARAVIATRHSVSVEVPEEIADTELPKYVNYAYFLRVNSELADLRGGNNLPAPAFSIPVAGV